MDYIPRIQLENLRRKIKSNPVTVICGPRRCGKTTLLRKFLEELPEGEKFLYVDAEDPYVREFLSSEPTTRLKEFVGSSRILAIDEAQEIPNAGVSLKNIVDNVEGVRIVATGSLSFDLNRQIRGPLAGSKTILFLLPISQTELSGIEDRHVTSPDLETKLIFGSYPEVIMEKGRDEKISYLKELINSYLYKDLLETTGLRHAEKLVKILQLLALRVGSEVSHAEIAGEAGLNRKTLERYIELLEKVFVIFKLSALSRNLSKGISKAPKYFFYDVGVRNALINDFNPISSRSDVGALWEDYVISERLKLREYSGIQSNHYFWRTYRGEEIDLVEEREGQLFPYQIKWGEGSGSLPRDWVRVYGESPFATISRGNYMDFIT